MAAVSDNLCKVDGCDKHVWATGYCQMHYQRVKRHGDPHAGGRKPAFTGKRGAGHKECTVAGCDFPHYARGLCAAHYQRWRSNKDADLGVPVERYQKRAPDERMIDHNGYEYFYDPSHPLAIKGNGRVYVHRVVMQEKLGRPLRKGETPHHRNGRRADNRPENLELWVTMQPAGQRPEDLVAHAHEILARYGGDADHNAEVARRRAGLIPQQAEEHRHHALRDADSACRTVEDYRAALAAAGGVRTEGLPPWRVDDWDLVGVQEEAGFSRLWFAGPVGDRLGHYQFTTSQHPGEPWPHVKFAWAEQAVSWARRLLVAQMAAQ